MGSASQQIGTESFAYKYRFMKPIGFMVLVILAIFVYGLLTYTEDIDLNYVIVFIAVFFASAYCSGRLFDLGKRLILFSRVEKGVLIDQGKAKRLSNNCLIEIVRFLQFKNMNIDRNVIDELKNRELLNESRNIDEQGLFILGDAFDITISLKGEFLLSDKFLYIDFWPYKNEMLVKRKDIVDISHKKQKFMYGFIPKIENIIQIEVMDQGKTRVFKANAPNYNEWLSIIEYNTIFEDNP